MKGISRRPVEVVALHFGTFQAPFFGKLRRQNRTRRGEKLWAGERISVTPHWRDSGLGAAITALS